MQNLELLPLYQKIKDGTSIFVPFNAYQIPIQNFISTEPTITSLTKP